MVMGMLKTEEGASIRGEGGGVIHMVTLLACETAVAKVRYANLQVRLAILLYTIILYIKNYIYYNTKQNIQCSENMYTEK